MKKANFNFRFIAGFVLLTFVVSFLSLDITRVKNANATALGLPQPTEMVDLSKNYSLPVIKGLRFNGNNPFEFELIVDSGTKDTVTESEIATMTNYFLAALTIDQKDMWVNLSPYEKDRITSQSMEQTDLGKDFLRQDYLLKQLSASLTHPDTPTGDAYWKIENRNSNFETNSNVEIRNTFNKIWIVPDQAAIAEKDNAVYITDASLKVLTEKDYLAHNVGAQHAAPGIKTDSSNVVKDVLIPEISQEINNGKNFAQLRQMYHSIILAKWFKEAFKETLFKSYIDQGKVKGIDLEDKNIKDKIFDLYAEAFNKGVYNLTKKDSITKQKRHYFSGGLTIEGLELAKSGSAITLNPAKTFYAGIRLLNSAGNSLLNTTARMLSRAVLPAVVIGTIVATNLSAATAKQNEIEIANKAKYSAVSNFNNQFSQSLSNFKSDTRALRSVPKGTPNTVSLVELGGGFLFARYDAAGNPEFYMPLGAAATWTGNDHITKFHTNMHSTIKPVLDVVDELKRNGFTSIKMYVAPENLQGADKDSVGAFIDNLYKDHGITTELLHHAGVYAPDGNGDFLYNNPTPENLEKVRQLIRDFATFVAARGLAVSHATLGNEIDYKVPDAGAMQIISGDWDRVNMPKEDFFDFLNELAGIYKSIDSNRVLALGLGKLIPSHVSLLKGRTSNFTVINSNNYMNWENGRPAEGVLSVEEFVAGFKVQSDLAAMIGLPLGLGEIGESSYGKLGTLGQAQQIANMLEALSQFMVGADNSYNHNIVYASLHELFPELWKNAEIHVSESNLSLITDSSGTWKTKEALDSAGVKFNDISQQITDTTSNNDTNFVWVKDHIASDADFSGQGTGYAYSVKNGPFKLAEYDSLRINCSGTNVNFYVRLLPTGGNADLEIGLNSAQFFNTDSGEISIPISAFGLTKTQLADIGSITIHSGAKAWNYDMGASNGHAIFTSAYGVRKDTVVAIDEKVSPKVKSHVKPIEAIQIGNINFMNVKGPFTKSGVIKLYNIKGQLIKTFPVDANNKAGIQLDLRDISPGFYIIDKTRVVSSAIDYKYMAAEDPAVRMSQIYDTISRIEKEILMPGTGGLPTVYYMSDFHGEAKIMFDYIADIISKSIGKDVQLNYLSFPKVSILEQLQNQGIERKDLDFHLNSLGDYMDRGKFGLRCALAFKELEELGLADCVDGNHDYMFMGNAMGLHYPIYEGYDYNGHTTTEIFVKQHWNDPEIAKDRHKWWSERNQEYDDDMKQFNDIDLQIGDDLIAVSEIREELKRVYFDQEQFLKPEEKLNLAQLAGIAYTGKDYPRGFNALGFMSIKWWEAKKKWIKQRIDLANDKPGYDPNLEFWKKLYAYTFAVHKMLNAHLIKRWGDEGKWWYKFFNDLDQGNMLTVQWAMRDWLSHWGQSLIDELNEIEGTDIWDRTNYMRNPLIVELANYRRKNFTLYQRDVYGNVGTHGRLPTNNQGGASFEYKDITYSDTHVWSGLDEIQNDVRDYDKTTYEELMDALSLVNSWYAEDTTKIKPEHIKKAVKFIGLHSIGESIGVRVRITGHNPLNSMQNIGLAAIEYQEGFVHLEIDKGMSPRYKDKGGFGVIGPDGIYLRGYDPENPDRIIDNPPTVKLGKNSNTGYEVKEKWDNRSLDKLQFLKVAEEQLREELLKLRTSIAEIEINEDITKLRKNIEHDVRSDGVSGSAITPTGGIDMDNLNIASSSSSVLNFGNIELSDSFDGFSFEISYLRSDSRFKI